MVGNLKKSHEMWVKFALKIKQTNASLISFIKHKQKVLQLDLTNKQTLIEREDYPSSKFTQLNPNHLKLVVFYGHWYN